MLVWRSLSFVLAIFYHKWENVFHRFHNLSSSFFLFILLVIIKVYEHTQGISLLIEPIQVNNWYVFIFDTFICTLFLVSLAKQLESVTWLEWTGRRSIVYYFFSGGIPLIVSSLLQRSVWVILANTIVLLSLSFFVYAFAPL